MHAKVLSRRVMIREEVSVLRAGEKQHHKLYLLRVLGLGFLRAGFRV